MFRLTVGTQFAHIAQYDRLGGEIRGQEIVECGSHAGGVGIIGIDNEGIAGGAHQLRTAVAGLIFGKRPGYVGRSNPEIGRDSGSGQSIGEVITADELRIDGIGLALGRERE